MAKFEIPAEFSKQLRYVEALDQRTDQELIEALHNPPPVTTEKNVWTYWHSGFDNMPSWSQRNVLNWMKLNGPEWSVRILDTVSDSPSHALKWVDAKTLPESFVKGTMTGQYVGPHSADFLRGVALYTHGGIWLDVGCIVVRKWDDICWKILADPNSPYQVAAPNMYDTNMANHFVAARRGDPFIQKWHELFIHLWKGRKNGDGIITSPLIAFALEMSHEDANQNRYHWDFCVDMKVVVEYVAQVLSWSRVAMLEEPNGGFNGAEYYKKHVLLFDALNEDWPAEDELRFSAQDAFEALSARTDADPTSDAWQKGYRMVWRLLTRASMQKVTHGKGLVSKPPLGVLLDRPENEGLDLKAGTFFELLRYGSVHFEQIDRKMEFIPTPEVKKILKEPLLGFQ